MMSKTPTPHIEAKCGDIAATVLMPGDPLRAKFIAENFLEDVVCINSIRGALGYTGKYNGAKVSVMASGMGMPSMGIYSYELFNFYDVKNIIRVGTAGAINKDVALRDIILGEGACTDSNYASQYNLPGTYAPVADFRLLSCAAKLAKANGLHFHVGNLLSSDTFYGADSTASVRWGRMGVLAIEMEAAALYMNAAYAGKSALAICTVSDHILTGEVTTPLERQTSFTDMMKLALGVAECAEKDNCQ